MVLGYALEPSGIIIRVLIRERGEGGEVDKGKG